MEYTTLGRTGVQVSRLCFGTMSFGGDADEPTSAAMFHRCREAGINFFDCADVYNQGRSEQILGRLIAGCRDQIVLTSKVHGATGPDRNDRGLSRRHICWPWSRASSGWGPTGWISTSCTSGTRSRPWKSRCGRWTTWCGRARSLYPAREQLVGLADRQGAGHRSASERLARFECIQPMYNLVKRQAEVEILPLAEAEQLGVISYSPLGGGLADRQVRRESPARHRPADCRTRTTCAAMPTRGITRSPNGSSAHAQQRDVHPASLAVAWVMSHPAITAPIIGARNLEQLEPSLRAIEVEHDPRMAQGDLRAVDRPAPGHRPQRGKAGLVSAQNTFFHEFTRMNAKQLIRHSCRFVCIRG